MHCSKMGLPKEEGGLERFLLRHGAPSHGPEATSGLPPVVVNKVLLENSHLHLFNYCLQHLVHCDSRVGPA